jgi:hypothetical protein
MEDKVMFFCIFLIIIGLVVYQYFSYSSDLMEIKNALINNIKYQSSQQKQNSQKSQDSQQKINIDVVNQNDNGENLPIASDPYAPLRNYDYRTINDPLVPPLKRDDYNIPVFPIPTRGFPGGYKKMGTLIDTDADNQDKYKFLFLIGRQKYPGSTQYDYFVIDNNTDSTLKFELHHVHKELFTDDEIEIIELNKTYKVHIDRSLGFDYNPFIY